MPSFASFGSPSSFGALPTITGLHAGLPGAPNYLGLIGPQGAQAGPTIGAARLTSPTATPMPAAPTRNAMLSHILGRRTKRSLQQESLDIANNNGGTGFGAYNQNGDATPSGAVQAPAALNHAGATPPAYAATMPNPTLIGNWPGLTGDTGGGGGGGGGGGFDLAMDPGYMQSLADMRNQEAQLQAAEQAAEERAIVDFGDPDIAGLAGYNLDPKTADLARQNYASGNAVMARLNHSNELARAAIINRLAGHGILNSGELGWEQGEQGRGYGNSVYDARQKMLDYFTQLHQGYQDRRNSLQQSLMSAMQNAYLNAMNGNYGYGGGGGGGGGQSGGFEMPFIPSGYSGDQTAQAAAAYAAGHQGYSAHKVQQEGTITYQNGKPGFYVKYNTPAGSSTEWTPIG